MDQFGTMRKILPAIRDLLVDSDLLVEATADSVIVSDNPNTSTAVPAPTWFVITPSPQERFDQAGFDGGGVDQCTILTRIIVTIHSAEIGLAGPPDQSLNSRVSATNSLNKLKRKVLRALAGKTVYDSDTGVSLLNDPMIPAEGSWDVAKGASSYQVAFDIEYDEDLTDEEDDADV